jgi:hypothetical protein
MTFGKIKDHCLRTSCCVAALHSGKHCAEHERYCQNYCHISHQTTLAQLLYQKVVNFSFSGFDIRLSSRSLLMLV